MGTLFIYILKSAFCLILFYLFYRLLLSRDTFHRFNRIALLSIMTLSCLLPLIEITVKEPTEISQSMMSLQQIVDMLMMDVTTEYVTVETTAIIPVVKKNYYIYLLLIVYLAGFAFFLLRYTYSHIRLLLLLKSADKSQLDDGIKLYVHNTTYSPFSWMRLIVISREDLNENGREVLIHEKAHICHLHSYDIILADVCAIFQWFNPAIWLLKQELQNIHEYEADEEVIKQGVDAKKYQLLLIKKAVGTRLYSMANSLNHSSLKKRITMMLKEKSSPWARLKYLYVLPLAAIAVSAFARPEISETMDEISNAKISNLLVSNETDVTKIAQSYVGEKVYSIEQVDKTPVPTHDDAYWNANLKLPATEKEGEVLASFIVNSKGGVSDVKVVKSYSPEVDAAYVKFLEKMPQWMAAQLNGQPVACKVELPMLIKNSKSKLPTNSMDESSSKEPLVIVDGKILPHDQLKTINPSDIDNINVIKGDSAVALYGAKAAHGAVIVSLKKDAKTSEDKMTQLAGKMIGLNVAPDAQQASSNEEFTVRGKRGGQPLVLVDGKVSSMSALKSISPNRIKSINVYKSGPMVDKYGEKAKEGIIAVTLKDENEMKDSDQNDVVSLKVDPDVNEKVVDEVKNVLRRQNATKLNVSQSNN